MPNDNMKYPFQFNSYAGLMSPLYLNTAAAPQAGHSSGFYVNNAKIIASYLIQIDQDNYQTLHLIDEPLEFAYVNRRAQLRAHQQQAAAGQPASVQHSSASHYQHQSRGGGGPSSLALVASSPSSGAKQFASVKRPLQLDDLINPHTDELNEQTKAAILEFSERFGDLVTNQPQVDLYRVRSLASSPKSAPAQWARTNLLASRDQLQFDRLARLIATVDMGSLDVLRGKLYNVNESNSLNTYFLPVNSDELQQLLEAGPANLQDIDLALQAHIIPDQVLFTRTMSLGQLHPTLMNRQGASSASNTNANKQPATQQVSLGLAKAVPADYSSLALRNEHEEFSRRLLASPLLLQAKCEPTMDESSAGQQEQQLDQQQATSQGYRFKNGLTQSEILLANIPIANGVLHLIRKPVLVQTTNLLDYINDNEHQLSNFVQALGSQSGPHRLLVSDGTSGEEGHNEDVTNAAPKRPIELNKFRELLTRDRQLLATFSNDFLHSNRTLLAPSDEAFTQLRYDLRALIFNDELLIPSHWDPSYRHDLLKRLIQRHIIPDQTITSDVIARRPQSVHDVASQNGQLLSFKLPTRAAAHDQNIMVECGSSTGRLIHQDLIGTNGVLHVIDRVLGEEQETVHSLLTSLVVGFTARVQQQQQQQQESSGSSNLVSSPMMELRELIEQNLRQISGSSSSQSSIGSSQSSESSSETTNTQNSIQPPSDSSQQQSDSQTKPAVAMVSPELNAISKTIGQYLDGLSPARRQLLGASVNISFHLAKLVSRAEGADDWNEKFQRPDRAFTYFVPNDLAWLKLQQRQPELYKPLVYFLDQQQQQLQQATIGSDAAVAQQPGGEQQQALVVAGQSSSANVITTNSGAGPMPRSSESSHRLLQILERHLIGNKKLATTELNQLASLQTLGATLRLAESQSQETPVDKTQLATTSGGQSSGSSNGAFAALHSIISGGYSSSSEQQQSMPSNAGQLTTPIKKTIEFGSTQANILQAYETSNGFVYLIDNVLILPEDPDYIVQTSSTPAISSTMSSLLGGHNSALLDLIQSLFSSTNQMSTNSIIVTIGTLAIAIVALTLVALVLIVRRYRQSKSLNRHQHLESGLTSSSSANSGSTSTTKSL